VARPDDDGIVDNRIAVDAIGHPVLPGSGIWCKT
jgi:hypothetical protein